MTGHRAAAFLKSLLVKIPTGEKKKQFRLSDVDADRVQRALKEDAKDYYFSGLVSFVEALRGPQFGLYSWATVKLYYSVFYTERAILALNDVAIFYIGERSVPWVIRAEANQSPKPIKDGNTHKAVLESFEQNLPRHLLAQPIGADSASDWLKQRREDANYRIARFSEPTVPAHFESIVAEGMRKALQQYVHPDNQMFAFDPEHAMIAYPFLAVRMAQKNFARLNIDPLSEIDRKTIAPHCRDERGPLPDLLRFLDEGLVYPA